MDMAPLVEMRGKLIPAPSNIPVSCSTKICWFVITVFVACHFIPALTFATSQLVWLGGCVCWMVCSTKSSFRSRFTLALQCPFLVKMHSQEVNSFAKFFWSIYNCPSLISFCCPRSVAVNLISKAVLFEWNEINAVLFMWHLWFYPFCSFFKLFALIIKAIHWIKKSSSICFLLE